MLPPGILNDAVDVLVLKAIAIDHQTGVDPLGRDVLISVHVGAGGCDDLGIASRSG